MTTLMFQDRFVQPILLGTKHHTIRPKRKRPIKPGENLSLRHWDDKPYRSPQIIVLEAKCLSVKPIRIDEDGVEINGMAMSAAEQQKFAASDGFESLALMLDWHREAHGLPFAGELIEWKAI